MPIKVIIIIILSILLSSENFSLDDYLTDKLNGNDYSKDQLTYALTLKLDAAYKVKFTEAKLGSEAWLYYAKLLARDNGQISKEIANYYFQQGELDTSVIWYKQAVKLSDTSALLPLVKLYISQNKLGLARKVLENVKKLSLTQIHVAVELAIAQGDLSYIAKHLDRLASNARGETLLTKISQYKVLAGININETVSKGNYLLNNVQNKLLKPEKICSTSMQLLATSLADLEKLSQFKKQFEKNPLNQFLCLSKPEYISINKLYCDHTKNSVIKCDEGTWQAFAQNFNTRYIALLYPYGKANVHLGIMYIDREDTFDIFSHEITHLLGFVDEYPLVKEHPKCYQVQTVKFAQNIAVLDKKYYGNRKAIRHNILKSIPWANQIKSLTPILTAPVTLKNEPPKKSTDGNSWLLGTPKAYRGEYGVFNADTCNTADFRSYKPLDKVTQLQYYQVDFPNQYLDLLVANRHKYLMPSFHYNIAMSLLRKGSIEEGRIWLFKSASMEEEKARKIKVLQAIF